jgi:putative ABC transport system permease protein
MIMLAIFSGTVLSVYLGIKLSNRSVFYENDVLDETILKG